MRLEMWLIECCLMRIFVDLIEEPYLGLEGNLCFHHRHSILDGRSKMYARVVIWEVLIHGPLTLRRPVCNWRI